MGRPVRIYNFGTSFFYSTLERINFQELLTKGLVPDAAIFLDGINEFRHEYPFYTSHIRRWWHDHQNPKVVLGPLKESIPLFRFASSLRDRAVAARKARGEQEQGNTIAREGEDWEEATNEAIQRYSENKRQIEAIAAAYDVEPIFVWQPMPFYKFDLSRHLFLESDIDTENYPYAYEAMAELNASNQLGENFLWMADIQESLSVRMYIDYMHYSPGFSEILAAEITRQLQQKRLMGLTRDGPIASGDRQRNS
jgi:hypothetical protein